VERRPLFKASSTCEARPLRGRAWPVRKPHRVRLGYEVGDGSDRWAPPGSDTGARGRPVSGCCEEGWRARDCWAVLARKKGAEGKQAAGGGEEEWAEPETGRGRGNPFHFSKFLFCSILLKRFFKIILN